MNNYGNKFNNITGKFDKICFLFCFNVSIYILPLGLYICSVNLFWCFETSPLGIPLENYMVVMSEKIVSADEDENIRHTFMAFDTKCKYRLKLMGVLNTNISNGMDIWMLK